MGALNIKSNATIKVLLGILFPVYAFSLEFKSTEELKLLPHQEKPLHQTRSRTAGDSDDPGDNSSLRTYVSKSRTSLIGSIFHRKKNPPVQDEVATILKRTEHPTHPHPNVKDKVEDASDKPEKVNPHVVILADHSAAIASEPKSVSSIYSPGHNQKQRSSYVTTRHSLSSWRKFYVFQKAPITNFYRHAVSFQIKVFYKLFIKLIFFLKLTYILAGVLSICSIALLFDPRPSKSKIHAANRDVCSLVPDLIGMY